MLAVGDHLVPPGKGDNEGFRKTFPCLVRDVLVCHEQQALILTLLETGALFILNERLITLKTITVAPDGLKYSPPLGMQQTFESEAFKMISIQLSDKVLGLIP